MGYWDQNKRLLEEIAQHHWKRGKEIGSGMNATVMSIGSYFSATLNRDLYLALYVRNTDNHVWELAGEMATILSLEKDVPHLIPEFPIVRGVFQYGEQQIGMVTEDFSQGSQYEVIEMIKEGQLQFPTEQLPMEIRGKGNNIIDPAYLATVCFMVNGQRRMGDFDELRLAQVSARHPDLHHQSFHRRSELIVPINYEL